jgi:myo-inositol-1(or 4)-monophosphatase
MLDDPLLEFTIQLVKDAGDLLLEYFHHTNKNISLKNDRSVVTEADLAVDQLISRELHIRFPGDRIISEELSPRVEAINGEGGGESIWVIDPLDGTTNFTLGLPFWGTLLTRTQSGMPSMTVMYFPLLDELYTAIDGQGGYLNREPIHAIMDLSETTIAFFACCSRTHRFYDIKIPYKTRILGSAAYSLCMVGLGAALIGFEATPKIWDIAGPWLLVKEAGGVIEPFSGKPPFPISSSINYENEKYPTLAAATPELMIKARNWIRPKPS